MFEKFEIENLQSGSISAVTPLLQHRFLIPDYVVTV